MSYNRDFCDDNPIMTSDTGTAWELEHSDSIYIIPGQSGEKVLSSTIVSQLYVFSKLTSFRYSPLVSIF